MPNLGYPRPLSTDKVEPDSEVRLLKCCSSKPVQPLTQSFDFSIQVIQASVIWGFHRGTLILFSFPVFHFYTSFFFQKVDKSLSLNKKKLKEMCQENVSYYGALLFCSNHQTTSTGDSFSFTSWNIWRNILKNFSAFCCVVVILGHHVAADPGNLAVQEMRVCKGQSLLSWHLHIVWDVYISFVCSL